MFYFKQHTLKTSGQGKSSAFLPFFTLQGTDSCHVWILQFCVSVSLSVCVR